MKRRRIVPGTLSAALIIAVFWGVLVATAGQAHAQRLAPIPEVGPGRCVANCGSPPRVPPPTVKVPPPVVSTPPSPPRVSPPIVRTPPPVPRGGFTATPIPDSVRMGIHRPSPTPAPGIQSTEAGAIAGGGTPITGAGAGIPLVVTAFDGRYTGTITVNAPSDVVPDVDSTFSFDVINGSPQANQALGTIDADGQLRDGRAVIKLKIGPGSAVIVPLTGSFSPTGVFVLTGSVPCGSGTCTVTVFGTQIAKPTAPQVVWGVGPVQQAPSIELPTFAGAGTPAGLQSSPAGPIGGGSAASTGQSPAFQSTPAGPIGGGSAASTGQSPSLQSSPAGPIAIDPGQAVSLEGPGIRPGATPPAGSASIDPRFTRDLGNVVGTLQPFIREAHIGLAELRAQGVDTSNWASRLATAETMLKGLPSNPGASADVVRQLGSLIQEARVGLAQLRANGIETSAYQRRLDMAELALRGALSGSQLIAVDPFGDCVFCGVPIRPSDGRLVVRHMDRLGARGETSTSGRNPANTGSARLDIEAAQRPTSPGDLNRPREQDMAQTRKLRQQPAQDTGGPSRVNLGGASRGGDAGGVDLKEPVPLLRDAVASRPLGRPPEPPPWTAGAYDVHVSSSTPIVGQAESSWLTQLRTVFKFYAVFYPVAEPLFDAAAPVSFTGVLRIPGTILRIYEAEDPRNQARAGVLDNTFSSSHAYAAKMRDHTRVGRAWDLRWVNAEHFEAAAANPTYAILAPLYQVPKVLGLAGRDASPAAWDQVLWGVAGGAWGLYSDPHRAVRNIKDMTVDGVKLYRDSVRDALRVHGVDSSRPSGPGTPAGASPR